MAIDTFIPIHPERIRTKDQVQEILSKIETYEAAAREPAGVVCIQNRQLGFLYEVVSESEGNQWLKKPRIAEWGEAYYPKSYFMQKRDEVLS